jgi:hypothetical protein
MKSYEPCCFQIRKRLESSLLPATLMGGKYLLDIINKIVNMKSPLKNLVYTYKYREIMTLI